MQSVQITVQDLPNSPALEDHLRKRAMKLNQFYDRINSCRIVVTIAQNHKHKGKLFCVHIDITVPGKELAVNRQKAQDIYVAVRDAFAALERQLESYARIRRGDVKSHQLENRGYIKRLIQDGDYGFIQSMDGNEHYFSSTNVTYPSFDQLKVGDVVVFLSVTANDGLQAHRITKDKHIKEESEL